ncbi:hypothetical protein BDB00DRAFT_267851 [Zychaea mexicana]|uniref:uncharacterized protein n=1 Tax=Zychaea mexicana TaxID=64656 RepID=UPI0022FE6550|nr:uncharacterized protein BDB00DRAFT_267851 [Zychaea mexicana]KAI9495046.1 hypothetical protein BDB00DRAFT_267851 [Zychaea mexicana]
MASRDIHERQDNVVTKRPRLLLHLKLQQIVDEGKKKKKIREKTKTSKASSKTADANFVPSIKQSSSSSTTTTAATAATAEAATTTTIPRKSKLEAKVSPKPAANGTSAKHTEPKKSATTNKADMVKDISEKRSSSKLDSATPAPASTAEITNNHSNNSKQMQRHQEDSPKTKDPTLATTTTTTTTTATPTNTTTTTTDNPSATRSTSSTADFLKSTRIPKRKQLPQDKVAHMDRELEEGETISPSPSPSREIPAPVLKAPETTTPSAAAAAVTKPSPLSEDNNRDRYDRSSPSLKDRSSHGRAASKDEDRVSSSKRTSRRSDDDTEWRRTERRDSNNRLRTDDDDKKRRSDDRARDDRSVDDRKLHRRDSRQSSITSSDRHRRRSRSPPSTIKTTSSSTSTTARAHKHPRSRSPRPAASRSRSPRARSRSSTRRSSPERERERRTSSSSSTSTLIREPEAKAPAPVYKNATSPDSETEQQCKMYALMFRKLATAYKHRGDPRQKDITGLIDHMQAVLNYVLSFYYQDKKTDEYQGLRHWESLYPFASIVMRHLQSKREMQLYSVCAHVMGMVRYYTFRRREMVANKKLDPLICEKNPQEAPPVKAAVAHDAAKATRQALTDFEDAYKFFKDAEKHMDQEQFREQFPQTHQMACEKGEYGPGIVIGGEAGISIEPRYPFVPFAKLHHAAIVAKVVLHEYLQKHNLVYTPISDTDEFM